MDEPKPEAKKDEVETDQVEVESEKSLERNLLLKVDMRLCTIAGVLCSLNLLDAGIISSAAITSMPRDLGLEGDRYSLAIFISTVSSCLFQLPTTLAVRIIGPRVWFPLVTICFGLITLCSCFVQTWVQMVVLRVLLGIAISSIFPGLAYLISTWYTRREQQFRFALLSTGQILFFASGNLANYGINKLDGSAGLEGWRWMFLVHGMFTCIVGIISRWWIVDFPEHAQKSFRFLTDQEAALATKRIDEDRQDVVAEPFAWKHVFTHFLDPKLYGFCVLFFLLNVIATSLAYFLPIILKNSMGFDEDKALLLSAPPYYYSVVPILVTSLIGDAYRIRGPIVAFNALSVLFGFVMLGVRIDQNVATRYAGVFLATGAYLSNWPALYAYQANNVVGQWKRATFMAVINVFTGLGGISGSYIVRAHEAPHYTTAVWVSIGSQVMMLAVVAIFTIHFYKYNSKQQRGLKILEKVVSFDGIANSIRHIFKS
ncbi:hypothetical protein FQN57_006140 [Myotisia sp. PD_48]|nr:hypothetical protein FQN57_006140 [Myotisia sp. PD_48]